MRSRLRSALLVCLALMASGNVYATINDLLQRASPQKLAEAAAPDANLVDGALLAAAVAADDIDADLAGESDAARTAVKAAIAAINAEIKDASAVIDGYIGPSAAIGEDTLRAYAIDIALWRILGGDNESDTYLSYKQVTDWLSRVSQGNTAHGPVGPDQPGQAAAGARVAEATPLFTRRDLGAAGNDDDY